MDLTLFQAHQMGVEDGFSNQFSLIYNWILENWPVIENKIERIKCLIENKKASEN